jgi:hypothetical protein
MNGRDPSTFSAYVLSLLTAVEASPATLTRSLRQFPPPPEFQPLGDSLKRPSETDEIISSLSRIAERLARSECHLPPKLQQLEQGAVTRLGNNAVVKNESEEKLAELREKEIRDKVRETENQLGSPVANWDDETEGELSAAEELRLLKAQVRDFARVCKVSTFPPFLLSPVVWTSL